jgi:hypothetical protein
MHVLHESSVVHYSRTDLLLAAGQQSSGPAATLDDRCADPILSYVTQEGDTPKSIVAAVYSDRDSSGNSLSAPNHWRVLWALVVGCNQQALGPQKAIKGNKLVPPGIMIAIPDPEPVKSRGTKPKPKTGKGNGTKNKQDESPVLRKLCGCTADVTITSVISWRDVVVSAYPEEPEVAYATGLLQMCNRDASFDPKSDGKMLSPGQKLRGICLTIKGLSFSKFLAQTNLAMGKLMAEMADQEAQAAGVMSGGKNGSSVFDEQTAGAASADGTCSIGWTSSQAVRDVKLSNSCPVYHNACSGPSDALSYQVMSQLPVTFFGGGRTFLLISFKHFCW